MELKKALYFRSVSGKTEEGETEESLHVSSQTNMHIIKNDTQSLYFPRKSIFNTEYMHVAFLQYYLQS